MFKQLANRRWALAVAIGWLLALTAGQGSHAEAFQKDAHPAEMHPPAEVHPAAGAGAPHPAGEDHEVQGPITWKTDLALWSLIVFGLFVVVLTRFAWKPLIAGLDKRELGIRSDIEAA